MRNHLYKNDIADQYSFIIRKKFKNLSPQVLRIIGLPSCGKTRLALSIADKLRMIGLSCSIYEDAREIEINRDARSESGLSGIDYDIFSLRNLEKNLRDLLDGKNAKTSKYSHTGNNMEESEEILVAADVIVLDGFAWQHNLFEAYLTSENCTTISLLPDNMGIWEELSLNRDTSFRGYSALDAKNAFMVKKATFIEHATDLDITKINNYYVVDSVDISRELGDRYQYVLGNKKNWPHINIDEEKRKIIFLAYQFKDEVLADGLQPLLSEKGFTIFTGRDLPGQISAGILNRIKKSHIFIGIFTKRDQLTNGNYTISSWLLEEKGAALMANKKVILMVEEGVDEHYIGYLQADVQRIHFSRESFARDMRKVLTQL